MSSSDVGHRADTNELSEAGAQPDPGSATTDRNERIREIAYYLWLDEGCPEGGAERHWGVAELHLEAEDRKSIEGEPPGEPLTSSSPALEVRRRRAL